MTTLEIGDRLRCRVEWCNTFPTEAEGKPLHRSGEDSYSLISSHCL
ncbi:hypothetical protein [Dendronalium sp. ChiSLP03b]